MKEKKIFDAVTNVPDSLIEEARKTKLKRTFHPWKKWAAIAACLAFVIGFASVVPQFGGNPDGQLGSNSEGPLLNVIFPKVYAFDDIKTKQEIMKKNPVDDSFLTAVNDFSYKTASQILAKEDGNTNYSPVSLYYALAMAASGAEGETANELLSLLEVPDQAALSKQCGNLYRQMYVDNKIGKLQIGNSLWMDRSIFWKNDYIDNAAKNFYAHSFSVDFSDTKTEQLMSEWVADRTNGMIHPKIKINSDEIFSIINTIYFYDEWLNEFDPSKTEKDKFYLPDSTTANCDFMNGTDSSSGFTIGDNFTRSSLGLKNGGRMIFVLPDKGISPRELLSSPEKVKEIFETGKKEDAEVVWKIPKFDFGSSYDFINPLKRLGVKSAFQNGADFSGITDHTAFITNIHQGTHIGIDENGVEASAFTQIFYSGAGPLQGKANMILNRPFIYGITASNGTLLFVGICENPTK